MTFKDWLKESKDTIDRFGLKKGSKFAAQEFLVGMGRRTGPRLNYGENYWEKDWEVLILLDACRHDLMSEVAGQYDFLPNNPGYTYSPASMSEEFFERHVSDEYTENIEETALICGNPFTRNDWVKDAPWAHIDEVWKREWDEESGTVLPRSVTNSAVHRWRKNQDAKMIIWYMQPHVPFIEADWSHGYVKEEFGKGAGEAQIDWSPWYKFRHGDLELDELWGAYRRNLELVLEEVGVLLSNLECDNVVISSDHANAIGEWGVYGHPKYVQLPVLKKVPWISTQSKDTGRLSTTPPEAGTVSDEEVDERLKALGYK